MDGGNRALLEWPSGPDQIERQYFLARAEAELECAQRSMCPEAVRSHYALAGHYLDLVYNDEAFRQWKHARAAALAVAAAGMDEGAASAA